MPSRCLARRGKKQSHKLVRSCHRAARGALSVILNLWSEVDVHRPSRSPFYPSCFQHQSDIWSGYQCQCQVSLRGHPEGTVDRRFVDMIRLLNFLKCTESQRCRILHWLLLFNPLWVLATAKSVSKCEPPIAIRDPGFLAIVLCFVARHASHAGAEPKRPSLPGRQPLLAWLPV